MTDETVKLGAIAAPEGGGMGRADVPFRPMSSIPFEHDPKRIPYWLRNDPADYEDHRRMLREYEALLKRNGPVARPAPSSTTPRA